MPSAWVACSTAVCNTTGRSREDESAALILRSVASWLARSRGAGTADAAFAGEALTGAGAFRG